MWLSPGALRLNKKRQLIQALGGIVCLVAGVLLALYPARRYEEHRYIVDAAACRMDLLLVSRADLLARPDTGSVVLLHGISANKIVMQYLARAFAELGLRVYVPDLPGHGRSPGPFTPEQAESCSASLLRGLAARGMIVPDRTIIAGHSMGAAIALRLADKFRPAGVIAISPAPMIPAHAVIHENLLFHTLPILTPNTLIIVGQLEPQWIRENAADLASNSHDPSVKFEQVPRNTHVSMLFSPAVARETQAWAASVLNIPDNAQLPSHANLLGCLLGIVGLLLIAGPFLREMVGGHPLPDVETANPVPKLRGALELLLLSVAAVHLLHYWQPLRIIHLFEGDYLASFFLIVGVGLMLLHVKAAREGLRARPPLLIGAAAAGLLLHFLATGWFELTATGAWLNVLRWERFPLFLVAVFVFLYGLELVAGPAVSWRTRYPLWMLLVALAWLSLASAMVYLKSGEILLVLLSPYFALLFLLSGLGIHLVRRESRSSSAAALFGAILLAGFCLVLFPLS
jgi:alpha-beta hydrolase superfamily lysophospholipase